MASGVCPGALRCEQAGREVAGIHQSEGASLSSGEGVRVYANSHGFLGTQKGSSHSLSCMLIAQDEQGMQRDYDYTSARNPQQLRHPEEVGREAAARTLRRLGARRPPTGTFPVLFEIELLQTVRINHVKENVNMNVSLVALSCAQNML